MRSASRAFTLTELLVALGVGLVVLNAAFVVFLNTGKFFKRIESVGTKNDIAQTMILWVLAQKDLSTPPTAASYPQPTDSSAVPALTAAQNDSVPQFRRIGAAHLLQYPSPGDKYVLCAIRDFSDYQQSGATYTSTNPTKTVIQPVYMIIPATKN